MKHYIPAFAFLLLLLNSAVFAQAPRTKRLESLPSLEVALVKDHVWKVRSSPDGKRIVIHDSGGMVIIDIGEKKGVNAIETKEVSDAKYRDLYYHLSPNLRYRIGYVFGFQTYAPPKSGAAGMIATTFDWQTRGSGLLDSDDKAYRFGVIEKYYPLAATNDGKIISTKPLNFKKDRKFGPPIPTKYEGLFLVDPIANTSVTLSEDKFTPKDILLQSPDSKIFCWIGETHSDKGLGHIVHAFDLTTGKSWTFSKPFGDDGVYQLSGTTLLSKDYQSSSEYITLYDIRTGKVIAKETAVHDPKSRLFLKDSKLYFFSGDNYSVAELKPDDKQGLQVMPPVVLDTTDLQIDPKRAFFSLLAGDQLLIIPVEKLLERPTRAWFFDLTTGKPTFVIFSLFPNIYPPSVEYTARLAAADCERATSNLTLPVGAVLVEKGGDCNKPSAFIISYDCKTNMYYYGIFEKDGVRPEYSYSFEVAVKYQYCTSSNIKICSNCKGVGHYKETVGMKLDKWEQTNFNVYVRDPNKVTRVEVTTTCPVCNGRGVL